MNRLPMKKLTKNQFTILGNVIAYAVLNGMDARQRMFICDGRIASGMFKKGLIEIEPNRSQNRKPVWLITDAGIDVYWYQKNGKK